MKHILAAGCYGLVLALALLPVAAFGQLNNTQSTNIVANWDLEASLTGSPCPPTGSGQASNGALAYARDTETLWACNGVTWVLVGNGDNIYNSDGTLTGNRLLDGNTFSLDFQNLSELTAVSTNGTVQQILNFNPTFGDALIVNDDGAGLISRTAWGLAGTTTAINSDAAIGAHTTSTTPIGYSGILSVLSGDPLLMLESHTSTGGGQYSWSINRPAGESVAMTLNAGLPIVVIAAANTGNNSQIDIQPSIIALQGQTNVALSAVDALGSVQASINGSQNFQVDSQRVSSLNVPMNAAHLSAAPGSPFKGDMFWFDDGGTNDCLCVYDGTAWVSIVTVAGACPP